MNEMKCCWSCSGLNLFFMFYTRESWTSANIGPRPRLSSTATVYPPRTQVKTRPRGRASISTPEPPRSSRLSLASDLSGSVLVAGSKSRNRAVHGDVVAVELLPKSEWRGQSGEDGETQPMATGGSGSVWLSVWASAGSELGVSTLQVGSWESCRGTGGTTL